MENNINKENDGIIAFLLWTQGGDFDEINQEQRDALPPLIESWPPVQKRYISRIGRILLTIVDSSQIKIDEAKLLSIDEAKLLSWENYHVSIEAYVKSLNINKELEELYLDFAKCLVGSMNGSNNGELLQEKMQLIVSKES